MGLKQDFIWDRCFILISNYEFSELVFDIWVTIGEFMYIYYIKESFVFKIYLDPNIRYIRWISIVTAFVFRYFLYSYHVVLYILCTELQWLVSWQWIKLELPKCPMSIHILLHLFYSIGLQHLVLYSIWSKENRNNHNLSCTSPYFVS